MTLVGILCALLLERLLSHWPYWRTHDLTAGWLEWLRRTLPAAAFWGSSWGFLVLVLPPTLLVYAVLSQLIAPLGVVVELAGSVLVLLACLGPRDVTEEIGSYRAARDRGAEAAAELILQDLIAGPERGGADPHGRSPVAASFVQGHERTFGVLLWFFVLGALGALLYRLAASTAAHLRRLEANAELIRGADRWHGLLAWLPARLTALCFVLAGSADHAAAAWRDWRQAQEGARATDAWGLLAAVGMGSLGRDGPVDELSQLESAVGVMTRALLIFLAVLSVFTVGGWLA